MKKNLARFAALGGAIVLAAGIGHQWAQAAAGPSTPTYTGCLSVEGSNKGKFFAAATGSTPTRTCSSTEKQVRLSGGDITSIAAGTGLRVTSTELGLPDGNGDASLDLAPSYRLPQACDDGQTVTRTGSTWGCASPPAPLPGAKFGWTDGTLHDVGDAPAVLGDGMDLPAGTYTVQARVAMHGGLDTDHLSAYCRLDATGQQGLDGVELFVDDGIASLPVVLTGTVSRTAPFRVSVVCRDNGDGVAWSTLRLLATPVAALQSVQLAH